MGKSSSQKLGPTSIVFGLSMFLFFEWEAHQVAGPIVAVLGRY